MVIKAITAMVFFIFDASDQGWALLFHYTVQIIVQSSRSAARSTPRAGIAALKWTKKMPGSQGVGRFFLQNRVYRSAWMIRAPTARSATPMAIAETGVIVTCCFHQLVAVPGVSGRDAMIRC